MNPRAVIPLSTDPRTMSISFFFFNDTATTEIYTLSLHDALPICMGPLGHRFAARHDDRRDADRDPWPAQRARGAAPWPAQPDRRGHDRCPVAGHRGSGQ